MKARLSIRVAVVSLVIAIAAAFAAVGAQASGLETALNSVQEFLGLAAPAQTAPAANVTHPGTLKNVATNSAFVEPMQPMFFATPFVWDCSAITPTSGSDPNMTAAFASTQGNNNGTTTLITTTSPSTGAGTYAGASGTSNFGAATVNGALSTATSTYFPVTITPSAGFKVNLTSVSLGSRSTGSGPTTLTVYSNIDNYATAIGSATVATDSNWAFKTITFSGTSLIGASGTPVILRIYGSGGSGATANTAVWRIDDISLAVTATAASAPTKLAITSIIPSSPTAGAPFNVTVQSQDGSSIPSNVSGNTGFTLSTNGNAGAVGGTTTGTINASSNSVTVTGVTLPNTGTGVTLTATRSSGDVLAAGTSNTFSVLAAADHLTYVSVPTTGTVNTNLSTFTVEARRPDNSVDAAYTGNVTITKATGTGTLSGTTTKAAVAGVATFNDLQFNAAGDYTLNANSGSFTQITSGTITISDVSAASDQFRSKATGNWNATGTWESSHDGNTWIAATLTPTTTAGAVTIKSPNVVTVSASVSADDLTIDSGGQITVASSQTFTIANGTGTDLTANGILSNAGTLTVSGTAAFGSTGRYVHAQNGGSGPANTTWDLASTFEVTGWTNSSATTLFTNSVTYGNVTWNSTGQSATYQMSGSLTNIAGLFRVQSTNSQTLRMNSAGFTLAVGGIQIDSGTLQLSNASTATYTINNTGSYTQSGGTFDPNTGGGSVAFNFTGASTTRVFNQSGGTLTNSVISWTVNSGSTLNLSSNIPVASGRALIVNGTLNMGTFAMIGAGTSTFSMGSNATLGLGSPDGINAFNPVGNIQNQFANRTYNGTIIFNGTAAQVTGNGFPSTIPNLTINNAAGVTQSDVIAVSGIFTLQNGNFTTTNSGLTINNAATISRTSGYVIGTIQKFFGSVGAFNFPVGTANGFTPVSVNVTANSGGFLAVKALQATQPNITIPSKALTRYWHIDGSGLTTDLTFNYLDGDIPGTADELGFVIHKYDGSNFSRPGGSVNTGANTATITGVNTFSDWTLAENGAVQFTITPSAGSNGSITPNTAQIVNLGGSSSFTIAPDTGYHIADVLIDGVSVGTGSTQNFTNVNADHTISSSFAITQYNVSYDGNGSDGGTTPATQTADYNTSVNLRANTFTRTGYSFSGWDTVQNGNGANHPAGSSFTIPASNTVMYAQWTINSYTVTPSVTGNGTITPNTAQSITYNTTTAFTVSPTAGNHLVDVTGTCGGNLSGNTYTTNAITANCTVIANFAINTYQLTVGVGQGQGTTNPSGTSTVNHGASTPISAGNGTGYHFVDWVVAAGGANASVFNANSASTTVILTGDATVNARFALNQYAVTYTAGPHGSIIGTASQTVNHGDDASAVTADPDPGYAFVNWSDNSTDNPRHDLNVQGPISVTANFAVSNHEPVAATSAVSVTDGNTVKVTFSATDADNDALTFAVVTPKAHGTVTTPSTAVCAGGTCTSTFFYTPDAGYTGSDQITYTASDATTTSANAFINITDNAAVCDAPPAGMVAWYRASGDAWDVFGNDATFTPNTYTTGKVGQAFSFDGVDDYASIPATAAVEPVNLTLDAWVNFASLDSVHIGNGNGQQRLIHKQNTRSGLDGSFDSYELGKFRDTGDGLDKMYFCVSTNAGVEQCALGTSSITTGNWYHVAATFDDDHDTMKLYVNGVAEASVAVPGRHLEYDSAKPVILGRTNDPEYEGIFHGSLDEVEIFNTALTDQNVLDLYNASFAGKCSSAPSVTAQAPTGVSATAATLNGTVTSTGGVPVTARGFVYSLTSLNNDPVIGGTNVTQVAAGSGTGAFSGSASPLIPAAGYSYKAYATNNVGTTYSTPVSTFSPSAAAATTTTLASSVNPTTFGGATTLTAKTVQTTGGANVIGVGTLAIKEGDCSTGTTLASATPDSNGEVVITGKTDFTGGDHSLIACYTAGPGFTSSESATLTQHVNPANQTITVNGGFPNQDFILGSYSWALPTAPGGTVEITGTSGICTVGDPHVSTVTFNAVGSCTIHFNQPGNSNYNAAPEETRTFTINPSATVTEVSIAGTSPKAYGAANSWTVHVKFFANTSLSPSSGNVKFVTGTCASPTATLQGDTAINGSGNVVFSTATLDVGTYDITACYSGGGSTVANSSSTQFQQEITKINQPTLTIDDPGTVTYGQTPTLHTSGGGGTGAVTWSHGVSTGCTIDSSTGVLTVTNAAGSCDITAVKAADTNHNVSNTAQRTITLAKATQTALVVTDPGTVTYGTSPQLATTGGSGTGGVTFDSTGSIGCSVTSGGVLTVSNAQGSCSITATKAADTNYNAATSAARSITLARATATITFTSTPTPNYPDNAAFVVSTTTNSDAPVTYSTASSTVCTHGSGVNFTAIATGHCVVDAATAQTNNYTAGSNSQDVNVAQTTYTITPSVTGGNGTITPNSATTVNAGANQTFTFAPNAGYQVDVVKVDGSPVTPTTPTTYQFTNVHATHTIDVTFVASACHTMTAGTQTTYNGATITVPVSISTATLAEGVLSADLDLTYNTAVLSAVHTTGDEVSATKGTANSDGSVVVSEDVNHRGTLHIAAYDPTGFETSGGNTFVLVSFTVVGHAGDTSTMGIPSGATYYSATGALCADRFDGLVTIAARGTSTSVSTSGTPSIYGNNVTLTATMTPTSGTNPPAVSGGSVTFYDGGTDCTTHGPALGSAVNLTGNQAAITTGALSAGSHTIFACYSGSTDFTASSGTVTQNVGQASQTITFGALDDKTYGDAAFDVVATGGASGNPVTFTVSGNCSNSGTNGEHITITGAGSCTVTAHQAGNANYSAAANVDQSFNIAKAAATISVVGFSGTYDGNPHGVVSSSAKGVFNEDLTGLSIASTTYINVPGGLVHWTFTNENYADQAGDATVTITKATATISVVGFSGTYDGNPHGVVSSSAKGVNNEDLSGLSIASTTYINVPGGLVHWTFTNANYADQSGDATVTINKATPTATLAVTNSPQTYDGSAKSATVGITTSSVPGSVTNILTGGFATRTNAGTYAVTADFIPTDSTNYNSLIGVSAGDFVIEKATPTATLAVTNSPQTYDGSAKSATVGITTSSVPGSVTNILTGGSATKTNAGTYAVTADFVPTDTTNYNSLIGVSAGNFVIDKATPTATLTVTNSPQTYDGSAKSATVGITTSSVPGSVMNILTGGAATQTNAGTYAVTADFVPTDTTNYNSLIGVSAGNFVIDKATPTATLAVNNSPQTYDGTGKAATVTITASSVPGSVSNILTGGAATKTNAGTYAVTADFVPTDTTNYNTLVGVSAGDFVINKATPTATLAVTNSPQTYNGSAKSATVGITTSSVPGSVTNILTGGAATRTNAGSYAVTADFVPTDSTNYNTLVGVSAGNFVIDKADATITVVGFSGTYDGNAHGVVSSSAKGVNNEDLTGLSIASTTYINVPGGLVHWTFTNENYADQAGDATVTITKATATISVVGFSGTYDGNPHGVVSSSAKGVNNEDLSGLSIASTTYINVPGGLVHWTFTNANYADQSGDATVTINKAATTTTVTFVDSSPYTYKGSAFTATVTVTGPGLSLTPTPTYSGDCTNVTTTNGCTASYTYDATDNYLTSTDSKSITITKAAPSCSISSYTVPYNGVEHMATGTCKGVLNETLSGLDLNGTKHTNPGSFTDTWTFTDTTGNYTNDSGQITDSITTGTLTGAVTNVNAGNQAIAGVTVTATNGVTPLTGNTIADGTYSITGFGAGTYSFSAAKPTQLCNTDNGITAEDAAQVARYVVHLRTFNATQLAAAHVSAVTTNLSSLDAAFIAQKAVGNCHANNRSGQWIFDGGSLASTIMGTDKVDNFTGYIMGDVDGDWTTGGLNRPAAEENLSPSVNAVIGSLPQATADSGTQVTIPFRIDNLGGKSVRSTQFTIEYDPTVVEPVVNAASVQGTNAANLGVVSNAPTPGLFKVAVYGAIPVSGDGVYVNVTFNVRGGSGSSTPLTLKGFRFNDNSDEVASVNGRLTVNGEAAPANFTGRVLSAAGRTITGATITLHGTSGDTFTFGPTARNGAFSFTGLKPNDTYTVTVTQARYTFQVRQLTTTQNLTTLDLVADQ